MHLFRVLLEFLYCSVFFEFSDWQLVQVLAEACHLFSSQDRHHLFSSVAAHRHPQLVPVLGKMLCSFQWAPSDHSHVNVSCTIASFPWYLDPLLRFLAPQ